MQNPWWTNKYRNAGISNQELFELLYSFSVSHTKDCRYHCRNFGSHRLECYIWMIHALINRDFRLNKKVYRKYTKQKAAFINKECNMMIWIIVGRSWCIFVQQYSYTNLNYLFLSSISFDQLGTSQTNG